MYDPTSNLFGEGGVDNDGGVESPVDEPPADKRSFVERKVEEGAFKLALADDGISVLEFVVRGKEDTFGAKDEIKKCGYTRYSASDRNGQAPVKLPRNEKAFGREVDEDDERAVTYWSAKAKRLAKGQEEAIDEETTWLFHKLCSGAFKPVEVSDATGDMYRFVVNGKESTYGHNQRIKDAGYARFSGVVKGVEEKLAGAKGFGCRIVPDSTEERVYAKMMASARRSSSS